MDAARWLPASAIIRSYAVHEAALARYSQRGMIAARWDTVMARWLYDVFRVRALFLHRANALPALPANHLGILGEAHLAGLAKGRRSDAREQREGLHTQVVVDGQARSPDADSGAEATSPKYVGARR